MYICIYTLYITATAFKVSFALLTWLTWLAAASVRGEYWPHFIGCVILDNISYSSLRCWYQNGLSPSLSLAPWREWGQEGEASGGRGTNCRCTTFVTAFISFTNYRFAVVFCLLLSVPTIASGQKLETWTTWATFSGGFTLIRFI